MIVLLTGAHDSAAPNLVRVLESEPAAGGSIPPTAVLFDARELLTCPVGARVVLPRPAAYADWLNLHRPVVGQRRLTLLLWCTGGSLDALHAGAPDFMDWISHRIAVEPQVPDFVTAAISAAAERNDVSALTADVDAPAGWHLTPARAAYEDLRTICAAGPTWVHGVRDAHDWLRVRVAHAEAGAGPLLLASPAVIGPEERWADGRPVAWDQAAAALAAQGVAAPALEAARREFDPAKLGVQREGPRRLELDKRRTRLLELVGRREFSEAVPLALELRLSDVTDTWRRDATLAQAASLAAQGAELLRHGEPGEALRHFEEVEALARAVNDSEGLLTARVGVADALAQQGDLAGAARILEDEVMPQVSFLGDPTTRAALFDRLARMKLAQGDHDGATRIFRELAMPAFEESEDETARAVMAVGLAELALLSGDLDEATRQLPPATLELLERSGDLLMQAKAADVLAKLHEARGEIDEALRLRKGVQLPVLERLGNSREQAIALGSIAGLLTARGELREALRLRTEEELPVYERLGDVRSQAITFGQVADLLTRLGDSEAALRVRLGRELPLCRRLGEPRMLASALQDLASLHASRGDLDDAERLLASELIPLARQLGDQWMLAVTLVDLGQVLARKGDPDRAVGILRDASRLLRQPGAPRVLAVALVNLAAVLYLRGHPDDVREARESGAESLALASAHGPPSDAAYIRRALHALDPDAFPEA